MDPLGLLLAVLALTVYPGGLYLAAIAWASGHVARLPQGREMTARDWLLTASAGVATALAPLPASPAGSLPPGTGAAPNLLVAAMLLAAALALAGAGRSTPRRIIVVAAMAAPLLLLAVAAGSLSIPVIVAVPGAALTAARACTAAALLVAAPLVYHPFDTSPYNARAVLMASTCVFALSLVAPASTGWAALLTALAVAAAAMFYAVALGTLRRLAARDHVALLALSVALASSAAILSLAVAYR
jgi:hypothetical protein